MKGKKYMIQRIRTRIRKSVYKNYIMIVLSLSMVLFFFVGSSILVSGRIQNTKEMRVKYYTSIKIQKGDTLWSIAEEYMTQEYENTRDYIDEIIRLNHLSSDKIHYGKFLVVPYYDIYESKNQ